MLHACLLLHILFSVLSVFFIYFLSISTTATTAKKKKSILYSKVSINVHISYVYSDKPIYVFLLPPVS